MSNPYSTADGAAGPEGAAAAAEAVGDKQVKPYDFKHPKLVSKEIMRAFRNIHELLSRNLNRIFTDSLNQKVDVSLEDIDEVIFSEFLSRMEPPTTLFLFNIEELGDWALIEMDPSFCLYCVERLGGSREDIIKPARALTRIEERVISRIVNKIFKELSHVWSPYLTITILNHVYESKPANVRTISSHIPGIVVRFRVKVGSLDVWFKICYPYGLLKQQMNSTFHELDKPSNQSGISQAEKKAFENHIKAAEVPIKVVLGEAKISMRQLMQTCEGDVLKLDQLIHEPLDILVNDHKKMVGYPGNLNGKKAVKVFEVSNTLNSNK